MFRIFSEVWDIEWYDMIIDGYQEEEEYWACALSNKKYISIAFKKKLLVIPLGEGYNGLSVENIVRTSVCGVCTSRSFV